jgi:hypothetical protein
VATNGALALAPGPGAALVTGIHPSLLLGFSPVTSTADDGQSWAAGSPAPGLARVPDALAVAPAGTPLLILARGGRVETARPASGITSPAASPGPSSAPSARSQSAATSAHASAASARARPAATPGPSSAAAASGPAASGDASSTPAPSAGPSSAGTGWSTVTSLRALAATPAGRACHPVQLTAVAFTPAGAPAVAAACARPGVTGLFTRAGGTWRLAGPVLPAALQGRAVSVLRLTRTGPRLTALLQAGTGRTAEVLAAWQQDGRWSVSTALPLAGRTLQSSSFGPDGATALALAGQHGAWLPGPGAAWRSLPPLPPGRSATLALPAAGQVDVLATAGSTLTAWQLHPAPDGPGTWVRTQTTKVPIQYGSSA